MSEYSIDRNGFPTLTRSSSAYYIDDNGLVREARVNQREDLNYTAQSVLERQRKTLDRISSEVFAKDREENWRSRI